MRRYFLIKFTTGALGTVNWNRVSYRFAICRIEPSNHSRNSFPSGEFLLARCVSRSFIWASTPFKYSSRLRGPNRSGIQRFVMFLSLGFDSLNLLYVFEFTIAVSTSGFTTPRSPSIRASSCSIFAPSLSAYSRCLRTSSHILFHPILSQVHKFRRRAAQFVAKQLVPQNRVQTPLPLQIPLAFFVQHLFF